MKKFSVLVLAILVGTSVLSACAPTAAPTALTTAAPVVIEKTVIVTQAVASVSTQAPKKIVVGLSWNRKDTSIIVAWEDYMRKYSQELGQKNNVEFEWIVNVAEGDPTRQASNIEDLINQKVDVIIARAEDAAAIGASARAAEQAGIPFITFDRESSTYQPTVHVGGDSYNQARSTAEAFADLLEAKGVQGKCVELEGDLRDMNAVNRSKGWHDVEQERGAWKTIVQVPTEWNTEKFISGTKNSFSAHPEANCIFLGSDFPWDAVAKALDEMGLLHKTGEPGHIWVAGQDVNPAGLKGLEAKEIDVDTTYDAYFQAVEAVTAIYRLAMGETLGTKKILVPGRVATPDNVDKLDYLYARDYPGV